MSPHTDTRGGSLILDRRFRRIGRIKRATGTSDPKLFRMLNSMLDTLFAAGRHDVLVGVRDGTVGLLQVWEFYRRGELDRLPTPEMMRPLADFSTWAARAATGDDNRALRRSAARVFLSMGVAETTIADFPALVRRYRDLCESKRHASFNRYRAAVQAYLTATVGRAHRLYLDVAAIPTLKETPKAGKPMSIEQFREAAAKLAPEYAGIAWAMAVTGMGRREYWSGRWEERVDRIVIHGTKRAAREREVPRVVSIAKPERLYPAFRLAWGVATGGHMVKGTHQLVGGRRVGDLRKTFARWLQEAKIPRTRRRIYYGHGKADVSDVYENYEVTEFLRADGRRLQQMLGLGVRAARTA